MEHYFTIEVFSGKIYYWAFAPLYWMQYINIRRPNQNIKYEHGASISEKSYPRELYRLYGNRSEGR